MNMDTQHGRVCLYAMRKGLVDMSARNPRIHGTGDPWATVAWALVGVACAPLAMWIAWALGKWAITWGCE